MMLGIQQVMMENKSELFWDLSRHDVPTIEEIVSKCSLIVVTFEIVAKEKRLIQK